MNYYRELFSIDDGQHWYTGYTTGDLWNGWATPSFDVTVAIDLVTDMVNRKEIVSATLLENGIETTHDDDPDPYFWPYHTIEVYGSTRKVCSIGAYSWIWATPQEGDRV